MKARSFLQTIFCFQLSWVFIGAAETICLSVCLIAHFFGLLVVSFGDYNTKRHLLSLTILLREGGVRFCTALHRHPPLPGPF